MSSPSNRMECQLHDSVCFIQICSMMVNKISAFKYGPNYVGLPAL